MQMKRVLINFGRKVFRIDSSMRHSRMHKFTYIIRRFYRYWNKKFHVFILRMRYLEYILYMYYLYYIIDECMFENIEENLSKTIT